MAFPKTARSGSTPYFLWRPPKVSLNPEVHSSNINTTLFFVASALTFSRKPFLGPSDRETSIFIVPIFLVLINNSNSSMLLYENGKMVDWRPLVTPEVGSPGNKCPSKP